MAMSSHYQGPRTRVDGEYEKNPRLVDREDEVLLSKNVDAICPMANRRMTVCRATGVCQDSLRDVESQH